MLTLLMNPIVRHDAPASAAAALAKPEVLSLRDRAGLSYLQYHRHFGHRFALACQKHA